MAFVEYQKAKMKKYPKLLVDNNNCLDFTGSISNKHRDFVVINAKCLHIGAIIKFIADDDYTRIQSIVVGRIIDMDVSTHVIIVTMLSKSVKYNIQIPIESDTDFVVDVKEPFILDHYSIKHEIYDGEKDIERIWPPYVGEVLDYGFPGSRDYYYLSNGSVRLDCDIKYELRYC